MDQATQRAEHDAILARIKPYVQAVRAQLQAKGQTWEDMASAPYDNELIDSCSIVSSGAFLCEYKDSKEVYMRMNPETDIRMARIIEKSIELRKEWGGKGQDQFIYDSILLEIKKQYGPYNEDISKMLEQLDEIDERRNNAKTEAEKEAITEERDAFVDKFNNFHAARAKGRTGTDFDVKDFEYGTLVCREYAGVASTALHYAGIENYCFVGDIVDEYGVSTGRHVSLFSKKSGNALEVTALDDRGNNYLKVLNKNADITKGDPIVAMNSEGVLRVYGTGKLTDGTITRDADAIYADYKGLIERSNERYAERINAQMNAKEHAPRALPVAQTDMPARERPRTAASTKDELLAQWKLNDGVFVNDDGRKVELKGEGNGRGYHFQDLGISLVPQGADKFSVFHKDKSIPVEKIIIPDEKYSRIAENTNSLKSELLSEWKFKDGAFVNSEGKRVELKGEGNGRGYHFHDLGCSLVPLGNERFNLFYKDKSIPSEKITIGQTITPKVNPVRMALMQNWEYNDGAFVNDEGRRIELRGEGNGRGYHFDDCSLVPLGEGKFKIFYKDKNYQVEKLDLTDFKKGQTAAIDDASRSLSGLAEYNRKPEIAVPPNMIADIGTNVTGQQV